MHTSLCKNIDGKKISSIYCLKINLSNYLIDDEAYELFKSWQHGVIKAIKQINLPQIEAKHAKIEGEVIRIAGILHYFLLAINPDVITNKVVINFETMRRAILLGNHFLRHFAYVCTKSNDDLLEGVLVKILKLLEVKGEITANDAYQNNKSTWKKSNMKVKDVGDVLLKLVKIGKATQVPTKRGVKIRLSKS